MTENAKINEVLRTLFALPISAEQRLGAFFLWGMLLPEDPKAADRARRRGRGITRYWADPEAYRAKSTLRQRADPEARSARNKANYYADVGTSRARRRAQYAENPEKDLAASKAWRLENAEHMRKWEREHRKKQLENFPELRALENLRSRTYQAVKGVRKNAPTLDLLGMELQEFKIYLQGQFQPGMTWENYGPVWHIDHVRPCASFDLRDPAQQRDCFHWSNLQPLFAVDNLRKGANFPG